MKSSLHLATRKSKTKKFYLSKEEELHLAATALNDPLSQEKLIKNMTDLIYSIALQYINPKLELADLFQEGVKGIQHALTEYDPSLGFRFNTYARWWVKANISDYARKNTRPFEVTGSLTNKLNQLLSATEDFSSKNGVEPSVEDLSKITKISVGHINFLKKFLDYGASLSELNSDNELVHDQSDTSTDSPSERLLRVDGVERMKFLIQNNLSELDRLIICKRYGLMNEEEHTLKEIADSVKQNTEYVRKSIIRIEAKLKKLIDK